MERVIYTLVWAAILQGLLLGMLYLLSNKHRSRANSILGFFILAFVFEAFTFVPVEDLWGYPTGGYFTLPEVKMLFPVLFLHYVLEKIGRAHHYLYFLKVHYFLAFAVIAITPLNIFLFVFRGETIYQLLDFQTVEGVFMTMQYYAFVLTLVGMALAIREIQNYKTLVKNTFSDLAMLQIRWLWQFVLGVSPIVLVWGLELGRIAFGGGGGSDVTSFTWLLIIIFIYFLSYKAYQQKTLWQQPPGPAGKYGNRKDPHAETDHKDYAALGQKLEGFMESTKIYNQHDLTLHELSKAVDISPRLISGCINRHFNNNFAEWVNGFRVDAARSKLEDPAFNHLSVEGIGSDSGFKSRSAMYAAFRKLTGHTPGYFRRE
ncbi:helix-turn-helix domain-containing protein [Robiginitalea sp. SC105]|uniref:AraC family transcriptional regulator n=1 Tax=Robiginitalea sp. SC105 TaxID=2762332 RepID=UPI00163952DC|nr:helix-turn-helix domain-containing protein [Robiginitalea sp. SC105]MBC2840060.1 helix-turn-helix domain-containing protein [Robiginitalea sp. SC105]